MTKIEQRRRTRYLLEWVRTWVVITILLLQLIILYNIL